MCLQARCKRCKHLHDSSLSPRDEISPIPVVASAGARAISPVLWGMDVVDNWALSPLSSPFQPSYLLHRSGCLVLPRGMHMDLPILSVVGNCPSLCYNRALPAMTYIIPSNHHL